MKDNANRIYGLMHEVLQSSNQMNRCLIDTRSSLGGWNDTVAESYSGYTEMMISKANALVFLSEQTKNSASRLNEETVNGFNGKLESLMSELERV